MLIFKDNVVDDIRRFFPNTSFPKNGPSDEFLLENQAYRVNTFKSYNERTEKLVSCDAYIEDGWAYTIRIENKTEEEIETDKNSKSAKIRYERNARLLDSDWTQGKDIPDEISLVWATYRQQLRDITNQEGFPYDVIWPLSPDNVPPSST